MADTPANAKPPQKKKQDLLLNLILSLLDTALTIFLFVTPFCTMGAYVNFTMPIFAVGVIYVIVRIILGRSERTRKVNNGFIILRTVGVIAAVAYYVVLFNFGDFFGWFYPVRKYLYIAGNYSDAAYSDAAYFDFLPDSIPAKASKSRMKFVPPMASPDALELIEIRFSTDKEGIDYMRSQAVQKGGVICGSDDWTYTELTGYCEMWDIDLSGAEVYRLDTANTVKAYAISEETGFCMVLWYR